MCLENIGSNQARGEHYMTEQWRDIPGWERKYQVSDMGRIRSYASRSGPPDSAPHYLTPSIMRNGYSQVALWSNSSRVRDLVHRLVLMTFIGPRPGNMDACHNNGIKSDNRLINLRWASRRDNHFDKKIHGTFQEGVSHGMSKLNNEAVREIRASADSHAKLARRLNVSETTIADIRRGRTWRHVTPITMESSRRAANV